MENFDRVGTAAFRRVRGGIRAGLPPDVTSMPTAPLHAIDGEGRSACGLAGLHDIGQEWSRRGSMGVCAECRRLVPDVDV